MTINEVWKARARKHLEAKVRARNLVNQIANEIEPLLIEAAKPWIGKKIIRQGGVLTERAQPSFNPIELKAKTFTRVGESVDVWFRGKNWGEFRAELKVCVNYGEACTYQEESVTIGQLGQTVPELSTLKAVATMATHHRKTDYEADAIQQTRLKLSIARRAVSGIESELFYFGEHDNG